MILEEGEHTMQTLLEYLNNKYTSKGFQKIDIYKYIKRGWIPNKYGGEQIIKTKQYGITIIKLIK